MADAKLTALSAQTVLTDDDLLYVVNDPAGTPAEKKMTAANVRLSLLAVGSLAALTAPTDDDLLAITDDPGGTPVAKKITRLDLLGRVSNASSFPGSPTTGDRCWRTDRNIEYVYDGTRWLSTQIHTLLIKTGTVAETQLTATTSQLAGNPWWNQYDIYIERFKVSSNNSATTAGNYFSSQLKKQDATTATDIGSPISGQNNTQSSYIGQEVTINEVVAASVDILFVTHTETGAATTIILPSITYRLVG